MTNALTESTTELEQMKADVAKNTGDITLLKADNVENRDGIAQLKSYIGLPSSEPLEDIMYTTDGISYAPHMVMPEGVLSIAENAYKNYTGIKSVKLPDTVTQISGNSFQGCTGLNRLELSRNVTVIGEYAFSGCTGLASINFTQNVIQIASGAFQGCSGLVGTLVLPDSLTTVGQAAFGNCKNLEGIVIPKNLATMGLYMLQGTGIRELHIPSTVKMLNGDATSSMPRLTKAVLEHGVESIVVNNFRYCSALREVSLPNTISAIGNYVFDSCTSLEFVTLEDGFNCNNLKLSSSSLYSVETLVGIINALANRTGSDTYTLTLGTRNLAKLTDEQKAIATSKNWILA